MDIDEEDEFCLACGRGLDDQGDCIKCHYGYDLCDCEPLKSFEDNKEQSDLDKGEIINAPK